MDKETCSKVRDVLSRYLNTTRHSNLYRDLTKIDLPVELESILAELKQEATDHVENNYGNFVFWVTGSGQLNTKIISKIRKDSDDDEVEDMVQEWAMMEAGACDFYRYGFVRPENMQRVMFEVVEVSKSVRHDDYPPYNIRVIIPDVRLRVPDNLELRKPMKIRSTDFIGIHEVERAKLWRKIARMNHTFHAKSNVLSADDNSELVFVDVEIEEGEE